MAISFHCDYCGKKIEAQDKAGGKWGKCPSCHNKVYVPDLSGAGDELKLIPVDENELVKQKELMAETYKLEQDILEEREEPAGETPVIAAGSVLVDSSDVSDKELTKNIVLYLRLMADGQLNEAEAFTGSIADCGGRAVKILDGIAVSELPEPELADVATQVLAGIIRQLRGKIG